MSDNLGDAPTASQPEERSPLGARHRIHTRIDSGISWLERTHRRLHNVLRDTLTLPLTTAIGLGKAGHAFEAWHARFFPELYAAVRRAHWHF